MVRQVLPNLFQALVNGLVVVLLDLLGRFIDHVCAGDSRQLPPLALATPAANKSPQCGSELETYIQMTAWASLDLEVPRRNFRRWSLVSWENVYSLASELWQRCSWSAMVCISTVRRAAYHDVWFSCTSITESFGVCRGRYRYRGLFVGSGCTPRGLRSNSKLRWFRHGKPPEQGQPRYYCPAHLGPRDEPRAVPAFGAHRA